MRFKVCARESSVLWPQTSLCRVNLWSLKCFRGSNEASACSSETVECHPGPGFTSPLSFEIYRTRFCQDPEFTAGWLRWDARSHPGFSPPFRSPLGPSQAPGTEATLSSAPPCSLPSLPLCGLGSGEGR